ncbi:hypothetical protein M433DRAFT_9168 [Acidomyces richmondensis BFW]|nr:hypothetical protein M433DRAFT_9168 [Acidomyces richmondensis BFW]
MDASSETSICNAITAYQTGEYTSIRKCATAFGVAFTTLQNRLSGRPSRRTGHQHRQILSPTEERTLKKSAMAGTKSRAFHLPTNDQLVRDG